MMRAGPLLVALCVSLMGIMTWLSVTELRPHAGGLAPFDERILGYTLAEAREYLVHLDAFGRAIYLVEMRVLDTMFPISLACFLGWLTIQLASGMHPWSRMILVLPAAGYAVMDLGENALVAGMLRAGVDGLDLHMVSLASQFTVTKWVLFLMSLALLAGLWLLRRRQPQIEG